jgi:hypothetical protein
MVKLLLILFVSGALAQVLAPPAPPPLLIDSSPAAPAQSISLDAGD